MSTKQNPGSYDCYARLADDEPYFVLRGKDPVAPRIIEAWVKERLFEFWLNHPGELVPPAYSDKLTEAMKCAGDMREWRARKGPLPLDALMTDHARNVAELMQQANANREPDDEAHERPTLKDA